MSEDATWLMCLLTFATGVLATMVAVIVVAYRSRDRWLTRGDKVAVGHGEYRSGLATADPRLRKRRFFVIAIAVTNIPIAAITLFLLVPAGLLAALFGLDLNEQHSWYWISLGIAALDGIPVAVLMAVAAFTVVRRSERTVMVNALSAVWSVAHHGAIMAAGVVFRLEQREAYGAGDVGTFAAVVAGVGLLHAIGCVVAAFLARPEATPPEPPAQDGADHLEDPS